MDCPICQQQQHVVDSRALELAYICLELLKQRPEQGGPTKAYLRQRLSVSVDNLFDSHNLRIGRVTVDSEAVISRVLADVSGDTTKAKDREAPIVVVGLEHVAHRVKRFLILVIWTHEMEGTWVGRVAVGSCVVNRSHDGNLPA